MARPAIDFKARGLRFLDLIGNTKDIAGAAEMMHPDCQFVHDDQEPRGRDAFLAFWPRMMAAAPEFRVEVRDALCEGSRVWVFSRVTGRADGSDCDDLHMFEFDDDGLCHRSHGVHRVIVDASGGGGGGRSGEKKW